MPSTHEIGRFIQDKVPIGESLPTNFEYRTTFHKLGTRWSTVTLSGRLQSLITEVNSALPAERHITVGDIIDASREYETSQMAWNSVRAYDEDKGRGKSSGWEQFHVGSSSSDNEINLHIALLGLEARKRQPEIIDAIRTTGFKSLTVDGLLKADKLIYDLLQEEHLHMTDLARQFRKRLRMEIEGGKIMLPQKGDVMTEQVISPLPEDLRRSYYYRNPNTNQIIAVGTVLLQLPPEYTSLPNSIQWDQVYELASKQGLPYDQQDLARGVKIIDELGHGMGSFNRGFLKLVRATGHTL